MFGALAIMPFDKLGENMGDDHLGMKKTWPKTKEIDYFGIHCKRIR